MSLRRRPSYSVRESSLQFSSVDGDDNWHGSPPSNASKTISPERYKLLFFTGILLAIAPWIYHSSVYWRLNNARGELHKIKDKTKKVNEEIQNLAKEAQKKTLQANMLEHENDELLRELRMNGDRVDLGSKMYKEAGELEEITLARIEDVEGAIRSKSKRSVIDQYGDGPYHVNVTLAEPPGPGGDRWFVIETASTDLMPHAVDHFLKLVDQKQFDGWTMAHQSTSSQVLHAIATSPEAYKFFGHPENDVLGRLAYTEHSKEYPIRQYSVVFSGRPGGPGFYINMGTSINAREVDSEEACFGYVKEGQSVLDRIVRTHRMTGKPMYLSIESIRLIVEEHQHHYDDEYYDDDHYHDDEHHAHDSAGHHEHESAGHHEHESAGHHEHESAGHHEHESAGHREAGETHDHEHGHDKTHHDSAALKHGYQEHEVDYQHSSS